MVYMVNEEVSGCIENHAMHFCMDSFSIFECGPDGIEGVCAGVGVPFVSIQVVEVILINNGVFSPC